jgi:phosphoenolpyruvate-protein phosphotransferase
MQILNGIPASKGIAIGPSLLYRTTHPKPIRTHVSDVTEEINRFHISCEKASEEIDLIYQKALTSVDQETAAIFLAHRLILEDPELVEAIEKKILMESINADAAFYEAAEVYAQMLENLTDDHLRARAVDVRDITYRVVRIMQNKPLLETKLTRPTIIIADNLSPSDTMQFDRSLILGFFTASGGITSHTAILSKALGIPAVVGSKQIPGELAEDVILILDGDSGELFIDPDEGTLVDYQKRKRDQESKARIQLVSAHQPAVTSDNRHVEVVANIGNHDDAIRAMANGAEGVGLFRTEFSYIERNEIPTEDELVHIYQAIFRTLGDYPVVVRTLDIGGDKDMPHLNLPAESNPFLGCRGIRLCLMRPDLFKPQLRAILRAGFNTNLGIMFPMVAVLKEIQQAKNILRECMKELDLLNIEFNRHPQIGIMIEVPAAALCASQLAKEVDFFSIGTNDLTQYTLAVDRTNPTLSHLVSALQPAVLQLIQNVISAAHNAGIWVGMCGEMAAEPLAVPILLGMGLDEFSMNPPAIPQAKEIIRHWDTKQAKALAKMVVSCENPEQIEKLVKNWPLER